MLRVLAPLSPLVNNTWAQMFLESGPQITYKGKTTDVMCWAIISFTPKYDIGKISDPFMGSIKSKIALINIQLFNFLIPQKFASSSQTAISSL